MNGEKGFYQLINVLYNVYMNRVLNDYCVFIWFI